MSWLNCNAGGTLETACGLGSQLNIIPRPAASPICYTRAVQRQQQADFAVSAAQTTLLPPNYTHTHQPTTQHPSRSF